MYGLYGLYRIYGLYGMCGMYGMCGWITEIADTLTGYGAVLNIQCGYGAVLWR